MALSEVARFFDLNEAQVAAGLLRSGGLHVFVSREYEGRALAMVGATAGDYRLWTSTTDAEDAKALIGELRAQLPARRVRRTTPAAVGLTAVTAILALSPFGLVTGWLAPAAARTSSVWRWVTVAIFVLLAVWASGLLRS